MVRRCTYPSIHFFVSRSRSVVDCAHIQAFTFLSTKTLSSSRSVVDCALGFVWCGVVLCGVVWFVYVWCGVVCVCVFVCVFVCVCVCVLYCVLCCGVVCSVGVVCVVWCGVVLFCVVWCGLACGKRLRVCVQDASVCTRKTRDLVLCSCRCRHLVKGTHQSGENISTH